jgi:excisionase family DNA binding protein
MNVQHAPQRTQKTFLTTGQVAAACQVSIPTVKRWIREGHLSAFQVAGGHHRVARAEFERFLVANNVPREEQGRPRVLIIDDERVLADVLAEALRASDRYEVEVARDGYEGLLKVGTFQPAVLLLDVRMPGLDGVQVCRRIKADPATRDVRILALTADHDARDAIVGAGADAFLGKPFDLGRLQAEVARLALLRTG